MLAAASLPADDTHAGLGVESLDLSLFLLPISALDFRTKSVAQFSCIMEWYCDSFHPKRQRMWLESVAQSGETQVMQSTDDPGVFHVSGKQIPESVREVLRYVPMAERDALGPSLQFKYDTHLQAASVRNMWIAGVAAARCSLHNSEKCLSALQALATDSTERLNKHCRELRALRVTQRNWDNTRSCMEAWTIAVDRIAALMSEGQLLADNINRAVPAAIDDAWIRAQALSRAANSPTLPVANAVVHDTAEDVLEKPDTSGLQRTLTSRNGVKFKLADSCKTLRAMLALCRCEGEKIFLELSDKGGTAEEDTESLQRLVRQLKDCVFSCIEEAHCAVQAWAREAESAVATAKSAQGFMEVRLGALKAREQTAMQAARDARRQRSSAPTQAAKGRYTQWRPLFDRSVQQGRHAFSRLFERYKQFQEASKRSDQAACNQALRGISLTDVKRLATWLAFQVNVSMLPLRSQVYGGLTLGSFRTLDAPEDQQYLHEKALPIVHTIDALLSSDDARDRLKGRYMRRAYWLIYPSKIVYKNAKSAVAEYQKVTPDLEAPLKTLKWLYEHVCGMDSTQVNQMPLFPHLSLDGSTLGKTQRYNLVRYFGVIFAGVPRLGSHILRTMYATHAVAELTKIYGRADNPGIFALAALMQTSVQTLLTTYTHYNPAGLAMEGADVHSTLRGDAAAEDLRLAGAGAIQGPIRDTSSVFGCRVHAVSCSQPRSAWQSMAECAMACVAEGIEDANGGQLSIVTNCAEFVPGHTHFETAGSSPDISACSSPVSATDTAEETQSAGIASQARKRSRHLATLHDVRRRLFASSAEDDAAMDEMAEQASASNATQASVTNDLEVLRAATSDLHGYPNSAINAVQATISPQCLVFAGIRWILRPDDLVVLTKHQVIQLAPRKDQQLVARWLQKMTTVLGIYHQLACITFPPASQGESIRASPGMVAWLNDEELLPLLSPLDPNNLQMVHGKRETPLTVLSADRQESLQMALLERPEDQAAANALSVDIRGLKYCSPAFSALVDNADQVLRENGRQLQDRVLLRRTLGSKLGHGYKAITSAKNSAHDGATYVTLTVKQRTTTYERKDAQSPVHSSERLTWGALALLCEYWLATITYAVCVTLTHQNGGIAVHTQSTAVARAAAIRAKIKVQVMAMTAFFQKPSLTERVSPVQDVQDNASGMESLKPLWNRLFASESHVHTEDEKQLVSSLARRISSSLDTLLALLPPNPL